MEAGGLDYSIRKKIDIQYLRDMVQLVDRDCKVERLKVEKARVSEIHKKIENIFTNCSMFINIEQL